MIYLLDRNQIIFHSVNQSEIHPALSEIAKFISLSIDMYKIDITETLYLIPIQFLGYLAKRPFL